MVVLSAAQYDVHSNWGNWLYAAGIAGGRVNVFNILKQSRDYDAQASQLDCCVRC